MLTCLPLLKAITVNIVTNMANDTTDHYNVFKMVDAYVDGDTVVEVGY
jgi:hypothetical protein